MYSLSKPLVPVKKKMVQNLLITFFIPYTQKETGRKKDFLNPLLEQYFLVIITFIESRKSYIIGQFSSSEITHRTVFKAKHIESSLDHNIP